MFYFACGSKAQNVLAYRKRVPFVTTYSEAGSTADLSGEFES